MARARENAVLVGFVVLAGIVVLVAGTAPVSAAPPSAGPASGNSSDAVLVVRNATYHLTPEKPGSIRVNITYHLDGRQVAELYVDVAESADVIRTDGLLPASFSGDYRLASGVANPSMIVEYEPNETIRGSPQTVDDGEWALVEPTAVTAEYSGWANGESFDVGSGPPIERHASVAGPGYVGNQYIFLGKHELSVTEGENQTFVIVRPKAANMVASPERVAKQLRAASDAIEVGERDDRVVVFVGTDPLYGGGWLAGGMGAKNDVVVNEQMDASLPGNAWLHEYVHTRQGTETDGRVWWFTEGFASYYPNLVPYRRGLVSYSAFRQKVKAEQDANVVLAERTDYSHSYSKGRRVLAALDIRIRRASDGRATLADLVRRMNRRDDPIHYPEFQNLVEKTAGTALDGWLDKYVRHSDAPPVPHAPERYYTTDTDSDDVPDGLERARGWSPNDTDTDDDGVSDGKERALFLNGTDPDTDTDGLEDDRELSLGTAPKIADTDSDTLDDGRETQLGTDPTDTDTDDDTLGDAFEIDAVTSAIRSDTDGDGIDDGTEVGGPTNATLADTDRDGLLDGTEVGSPTNPILADTDRDGLLDGTEVGGPTNPTLADTDGDGLVDGRERELGTDPTARDSDGDGLADGREREIGSDPTATDSDGDGLADGRESELGTDPTADDTDGDGIDDGTERRLDTDPTAETGLVAELIARLQQLL